MRFKDLAPGDLFVYDRDLFRLVAHGVDYGDGTLGADTAAALGVRAGLGKAGQPIPLRLAGHDVWPRRGTLAVEISWIDAAMVTETRPVLFMSGHDAVRHDEYLARWDRMLSRRLRNKRCYAASATEPCESDGRLTHSFPVHGQPPLIDEPVTVVDEPGDNVELIGPPSQHPVVVVADSGTKYRLAPRLLIEDERGFWLNAARNEQDAAATAEWRERICSALQAVADTGRRRVRCTNDDVTMPWETLEALLLGDADHAIAQTFDGLAVIRDVLTERAAAYAEAEA